MLAFGKAVMAELMQKAALKAAADAKEAKRMAARAECAAVREARLWQVKNKKAIAELNGEPVAPPKAEPTEAERKAARSEAAKKAAATRAANKAAKMAAGGAPVAKKPPSRKLLAHLPDEERARIFSERSKKAAATRAARAARSASPDPLGLFADEPCPPSPPSSVTSELAELFAPLPEGMTLEMFAAL